MSPFWPISHLLGILSQIMQIGWQPQSLNLSPEIQGENQLTGFHEELGASSKKHLSGVPGAHCDAASQVTSLGLGLGAWARTSASCLPSLHPVKRPPTAQRTTKMPLMSSGGHVHKVSVFFEANNS